MSRLQAMELSTLRKVARVTRMDHIRNELRLRLQQTSIVDIVRERRESWRLKMMEKPKRLVERILAGEVEGRWSEGRPRKWWGFLMQGRSIVLVLGQHESLHPCTTVCVSWRTVLWHGDRGF